MTEKPEKNSQSIRDIFAPVREQIKESGASDDEVTTLLQEVRDETHQGEIKEFGINRMKTLNEIFAPFQEYTEQISETEIDDLVKQARRDYFKDKKKHQNK